MIKKREKFVAFIIISIVILSLYMVYLYRCATNVPLMDYWQYINMFVEKIFTGTLSFSDLWQNDGIHRSPLQFIYFCINVKFFHMNTLLEIFLAPFVMLFSVYILYIHMINTAKIENKTKLIWFGIIIFLVIFNLNQYELLNEQFALSIATRMMLFFLSYVFVDKYLRNPTKTKKTTLFMGIYFVFVIEMASGGYFPAYVATIGFSVIFHWFVSKRDKKDFGTYIFLLGCLLIATVIYMYGIVGNEEIMSISNNSMLDYIKLFLMGSFVMLGVGVLGFEFNMSITMTVGILICILYIVAFIIYVKRKYYRKSYMPMLLFGYCLAAMGIIYLGRMGMYGVDYAYAPRYVCETNLGLLGFVWIVAMICSEDNKKIKMKKATCIFFVGVTVLLSIGIVHSDYTEWNIAPYRKGYGTNLINSIYEINELETEEFNAFQSSKESVLNGVELMKKYRLGIFYENDNH